MISRTANLFKRSTQLFKATKISSTTSYTSYVSWEKREASDAITIPFWHYRVVIFNDRANNQILKTYNQRLIESKNLFENNCVWQAEEAVNELLTALEKMRASQFKNKGLLQLLGEAYTHKGDVFSIGSLADVEVALDAYKKVLDIDPNNEEVKLKKSNLEVELGISSEEPRIRHGL
jgi:tetratricopeptide (TPR) repeat protein